jgi:hypothetical protein
MRRIFGVGEGKADEMTSSLIPSLSLSLLVAGKYSPYIGFKERNSDEPKTLSIRRVDASPVPVSPTLPSVPVSLTLLVDVSVAVPVSVSVSVPVRIGTDVAAVAVATIGVLLLFGVVDVTTVVGNFTVMCEAMGTRS